MYKKLVVLVLALCLVSSAWAAPAIPAGNIVGQWNFDNASTANSGLAGSVADGTLMRTAQILDTGGTNGYALDLTGGGAGYQDYMNVGGGHDPVKDPPSWADDTGPYAITDLTIQFDFRTDVTGADQGDGGWWGFGSRCEGGATWGTWYIEGYTAAPEDWFEWKTYGGTVMPQGTNHRASTTFGADYFDGTWHTLTVSTNATTSIVYVDDVMISETPLLTYDPDPTRQYGYQDIWFGNIMRWDGEGFIGQMDNIIYANTFVPEPATIALLGLGGLALLRRKR
jgi:hypothetical protein